MQVFLSWSGAQSKAVAETLSDWIGQVIQAVEPWISLDIDKGARWGSQMSGKLEASKVGIICLTPDNLNAPWVLFEAGALSKTKDGYVCTFLLGVKPTDVQQPLGQFQHTTFDKADIRKLMGTINGLVQSSRGKALADKKLEQVFETNWPGLVGRLDEILKTGTPAAPKERTEREMLQEILEIVRVQERRQGPLVSADDKFLASILAQSLKGADKTKVSRILTALPSGATRVIDLTQPLDRDIYPETARMLEQFGGPGDTDRGDTGGESAE